jgi:hypothetical protein
VARGDCSGNETRGRLVRGTARALRTQIRRRGTAPAPSRRHCILPFFVRGASTRSMAFSAHSWTRHGSGYPRRRRRWSITDADALLRLASAFEAAPHEVAIEVARWLRQMVANARGDAGVCPSYRASARCRDLCSCGDVLGPDWDPAEADV